MTPPNLPCRGGIAVRGGINEEGNSKEGSIPPLQGRLGGVTCHFVLAIRSRPLWRSIFNFQFSIFNILPPPTGTPPILGGEFGTRTTNHTNGTPSDNQWYEIRGIS